VNIRLDPLGLSLSGECRELEKRLEGQAVLEEYFMIDAILRILAMDPGEKPAKKRKRK
jgi:hypothetical protein